MDDNQCISEALRLYQEEHPHVDSVVAQDCSVYLNDGKRFVQLLQGNDLLAIYHVGEDGDVARMIVERR